MRVALTLALLGAACTGPQPKEKEAAPASEVVAWVNERPITEEDLALQPQARGHQPAGDSKAQVLEALITQELAAQRAQQLGLEPDPNGKKEIARAEAALQVAKRRAWANAWYAQQAQQVAQVTPEELKAFYQAHEQELRRQVRLVMALKRSEAEIQQLKQAVDQGTPFESVLAAQAQAAGIEGKPWEMGWLGYPQLPPAWRAALATMKPGEVSGVLKGDHGRFWLIQLLEVREGPELTFEAAQPMIQQVLVAERSLPAKEAAEAALREKAKVVVVKKPAD